MWSVWSDPVDIYLGRGVALVGRRGVETIVVRLAPTFPLERALQQMARDAAELLRGGRLRLRLGCAYCELSRFDVPEGLKSFREAEVVARTAIARQIGISENEAEVRIDAAHPGLGAVLPKSLLVEVKDWAKSAGASVQSIAPLWAEATLWKEARSATVRSLHVLEPDGSIVVGAVDQAGDVPCRLIFQESASLVQLPGLGFLAAHWRTQ